MYFKENQGMMNLVAQSFDFSLITGDELVYIYTLKNRVYIYFAFFLFIEFIYIYMIILLIVIHSLS